jgi:diguanylate cyclase (GGDEF)-like protein/PAS domain S-box-containing protein
MTEQPDESIYRTLVEQLLVGVYIVQGGRLTYANPKLAEMFGYSREELLALPSVLDLVAEEDREKVSEALRRRIEGEIENLHYTIKGRHKEGETLELEVFSSRSTYRDRPAVTGTMLDITERRRAEQALVNLSLIDELTRVYNRRGFRTLADRHLTLATRKQKSGYLLLADLDDLKLINDTFGHAEGDHALVAVAEILRQTFRGVDLVARLGGDEFIVFPVEAAEGTERLLTRRLEENLAAYNSKNPRGYELAVSVGIARFEAETTIDDMFSRADAALYEQKKARKAAGPA